MTYVLNSFSTFIDNDSNNDNVRRLIDSPPPSPSFAPEPFQLPSTISQHRLSSIKQTIQSDKLTVVLDLDETLLHSFFPDKITPQQRQTFQFEIYQQQLQVQSGQLKYNEMSIFEIDVGDDIQVITILRPGVHEFLMYLMSNYNIVVWSAGGSNYVRGICNTLFMSEIYPIAPAALLNWDHVAILPSGMYTKPLSIVVEILDDKIELQNTILIDNRRENSYFQPASLIHAIDFQPEPDNIFINDDYLMGICVEQVQKMNLTIQSTKKLANTFKQAARKSIQSIQIQNLIQNDKSENASNIQQRQTSKRLSIKQVTTQQSQSKSEIKTKRQSLLVQRQMTVGQLVRLFN